MIKLNGNRLKISLFIFILFIIFVFINSNRHRRHSTAFKPSNYDAEDNYILFWSKVFGKEEFEGYKIDYCGEDHPKCTITHDRKAIGITRTIMFHAFDDMNLKDLPSRFDGYFPLSGKKYWILFSQEPPYRSPGYYNPNLELLFDKSMTYMLDSDYPVPYFSRDTLAKVKLLFDWDNRNEDAPVVWISRSCNSHNSRYYVVKELSKYLTIHNYGQCLNNKKFPIEFEKANIFDSTTHIIKNYKFYLAFENSNCKDYVTEKLHNAFAAGAVPIVIGPKSYTGFVPNEHSYLKVDDFYSIDELAKRILYLNSNHTAYMEYHAYRFNHSLIDPEFIKRWGTDFPLGDRNGFCKLCKDTAAWNRNASLFNIPDKPAETTGPLKGGLYRNSQCEAAFKYYFALSYFYEDMYRHWQSIKYHLLSILCFILLAILFRLKKHKQIMHYE